MNLIKQVAKAALFYSGISRLYEHFFLRNQAVILGYHRIGAAPKDVSQAEAGLYVSTDVFTMQMEYLSQNYHLLHLADLAKMLSNGIPIPSRSCVVTFDDGTLDNFETAFPILRKYGIPSTFFVIGNLIGTADPGHFNEEEAKALLAHGQCLGSHSQTHPKLSQVGSADLRNELLQPLHYLQNTYGIRNPCFAYPYGDFNPAVVAAVEKAGYSCAVTTRPGFVCSTSNRFILPRILIDNESALNLSRFATRLRRAPRSNS